MEKNMEISILGYIYGLLSGSIPSPWPTKGKNRVREAFEGIYWAYVASGFTGIM